MATQTAFREGDLLGDRYLLVSPLAEGGMAAVWRARDRHLGREVAVKLLTYRLAGDRDAAARLHIEAQALARLSHPHIATVFDVGTASGDRRTAYLVMELVHGTPLSALGARLPWPAAVTLVAQVADALATAHAQGIVHRDVTAANVLLTVQGAKLVDFGICAVSGDHDTAHDGRIMGTTAYVAPERLDGQPVEPAVDVYALGVLMYLLLTGELPWDESSGSNQDINLVRHRPAPAALNIPGLPAGIDRLCLRCLDGRPWRRPTAEQVAEVLRAFPVPGNEMWKPWLAGVEPTAPIPPAFTGPTEVKRLRRQHRTHPPRRGRTAAMTAAAVGIAVATWAVTGWAPASDSPPQASSPAVAPPASATIGCEVSFQAADDGNGRFTASIAVTNLDQQPIEPGWRLRFSLPAGWRSDPSEPVWHQDGPAVMSIPGREPLTPGQPVRLGMTGSNQAGGNHASGNQAGGNHAPAGFAVDSLLCAATAATSTTRIAVVNAPRGTGSSPLDGPAGAEKPKGDNSSGNNEGQGDRGGDDQGRGKQNSARND